MSVQNQRGQFISGFFEGFPLEICNQIFDNLTLSELLKISLTSRKARDAINNDSWNYMIKNHVAFDAELIHSFLKYSIKEVPFPTTAYQKFLQIYRLCLKYGLKKKPIICLMDPALTTTKIGELLKNKWPNSKTVLDSKNGYEYISPQILEQDKLLSRTGKPYWFIISNGVILKRMSAEKQKTILKEAELDFPSREEAVLSRVVRPEANFIHIDKLIIGECGFDENPCTYTRTRDLFPLDPAEIERSKHSDAPVSTYKRVYVGAFGRNGATVAIGNYSEAQCDDVGVAITYVFPADRPK